MEHVLIDRLSGVFPSAEPPFPYLIGSFRRSMEESRRVLSMKDLFVRSEIESAIKQAKRLLVSYSRIHVCNPDMFAVGKPTAGKPTTSELLDLIFSEVASSLDGSNSLGSGFSYPPWFLEQLFSEGDAERLEPVMNVLYEKLRASVERVSVLGNFQQPLRAL
ncbi:putative ubiquitin conjugation factor E4 [Platanthera guangdongensis]|uniref:Ubiquitin conjugation factor E4 n=1 Tax=Platanthera guangdongensis TaxID=2320717 RepID=A0ABR2MQE7_9ASPA